MRPEVSIVLSTYNRASMLGGAIESILAQTGNTTFEVIVVDNNSEDDTASVVRSFSERDARVCYVAESKQGLSHARNAGMEVAQAEIVVFTDDDVRVASNWVERIVRVFAEHPEVGYAGGKVLPRWPKNPPSWMTREHWAPLALVDYGESPAVFSSENTKCLVGANLAFRRKVLRQVGDFSVELQRVRDSIGSMEDYEYQQRCWALGAVGIYDPAIVIDADVQAERLEKPYHRRWHKGHGYFHAIAGDDGGYTGRGSVFGVPKPMYRRVVRLALEWVQCRLRGNESQGFARECELWFIFGYVQAAVRSGRKGVSVKPANKQLPEAS